MSRRKVFAALFIVAGILFFAIPIVYYYTGMRETKKLTQEFEQNLEEVQEDETEMEETGEEETEATGRSEDAAIFAEGDVIAILEIEALGIRYPVVEGCSSSNLNKAIGHMSETGRIGEKGNCVLCGHNGSRYGEFFTNLHKVSIGDIEPFLIQKGCFILMRLRRPLWWGLSIIRFVHREKGKNYPFLPVRRKEPSGLW